MLLGLAAAVEAVDAAMAIVAAGMQWRADASILSDPALQAMLLTSSALASAGLIVYVVTAIVFLVWLRRSVSNARALGVVTGDYTPNWAVFAWMVPIANLVAPYRLIRDLHNDLAAPASDRPGIRLIRAWWTAWLVGDIIGVVDFAILGSAPTLGAPMVHVGTALGQIALFAAAILAAGVVRRVERGAGSRVARRGHEGPDLDVPAALGGGRRVVALPLGFAAAGALVLVVLLGSTVAGRPADPDWATFASPDGGFAAAFPRPPIDNPTTEATSVGTVVQHRFGSRLDAYQTFVVTYIDFPAGSISKADPKAVLARMATVSAPSVLLASSPIAQGAVPGVSVRIGMSGGAIADVRYYILGDRVYGLEVDSAASHVSANGISRFLDSFTVNP